MSPDSSFRKSLTLLSPHPIFAADRLGRPLVRRDSSVVPSSGAGDAPDNRKPVALLDESSIVAGSEEVERVTQIGRSSPLALLDSNEEKLIKSLMDKRPRVFTCSR